LLGGLVQRADGRAQVAPKDIAPKLPRLHCHASSRPAAMQRRLLLRWQGIEHQIALYGLNLLG
jgi:hypothetical protein